MDLSQVSVGTKIYIDIEVPQIAQKWNLEIVEVTEYTTIARTVVREAITLEERQGESYWHSMAVVTLQGNGHIECRPGISPRTFIGQPLAALR